DRLFFGRSLLPAAPPLRTAKSAAKARNGEDAQQVGRVFGPVGRVLHRVDEIAQQHQRTGGQIHCEQPLVQGRLQHVRVFFSALDGGAQVQRGTPVARRQLVQRLVQLLRRLHQQVAELNQAFPE